ncbi:MAG: hypothetical protein NTY35_07020 [Planctomycetota bacterium]|nr:hypothetical protein [Planctomycetota bacterium]
MSTTRDRSAAGGIVLGALLIGVGGLLLGLQVDANGAWCGTGLAPLAIGALLALGAIAVRVGSASVRMPRDELGIAAVVAGFFGLAFAVGGALAPGGPWMFFEVLLLVVVVTLRKADAQSGRWIGPGALGLLAVFVLFRLWISYQGSQLRWQVMSVDVPIVSWLPFEFLDPVKRVALGSFTPVEMGFPPAGLDFAMSTTLWALGFAACVAGIVLVQASAIEHENDRIHALIRTLPPPIADVVERLLPEEEWRELGLHGLPERQLARRIESAVAERVRRQDALRRALEQSKMLGAGDAIGFSAEIRRALAGEEPEERKR